VVGSLAKAQPVGGLPLDGLLIKKDFSYTLMAASHLHDATSLAVRTLSRTRSLTLTRTRTLTEPEP